MRAATKPTPLIAGLAGDLIRFREQLIAKNMLEHCRYFNEARTHQSLGHLVPIGRSTAAAGSGPVIARPVLNGLHHDYRRAA